MREHPRPHNEMRGDPEEKEESLRQTFFAGKRHGAPREQVIDKNEERQNDGSFL